MGKTVSITYCMPGFNFFRHIKEHLKEVTDVKEDTMSEDDLQFHYFKLHDNDGNDKLDGIELVNAMTHFHDEENAQAGESNVPQYKDEQLASMIDQILEEDDINKDGYIDYSEFVGAQKRADDAADSDQKTKEEQ